jgi:hypothetical protein
LRCSSANRPCILAKPAFTFGNDEDDDFTEDAAPRENPREENGFARLTPPPNSASFVVGREKEGSILATLPPLLLEEATTANVTAAALNANIAIFFPFVEVSVDGEIDRFCDSKSTLFTTSSSFETVP